MLGNANEWEKIEAFAKAHASCLREYIPLKNGIPSHDTIRRAMGTQTAIASQIKEQKGDYVLALKGNQSKLQADVAGFFQMNGFLRKSKKRPAARNL